jgi:hypothetical protein
MTVSGIGRPILPKEHGAWAVLYGSFLAGMGVSGRVTVPVILLLVGITAATLANGTLGILARSPAGPAHAGRRRHALAWFLIYAGAAALALTPLVGLFRMTFLLPFGLGAAHFFLVRALLIRRREDRGLIGELLGTAGLTMVGAVSHAVAVGEIQPIGLVLWLLLFLFFASGVFYVRMRVHGVAAERRGGRAASNPARGLFVLYHALLILAAPALFLARVAPWPVLLAFAPALWRAAAGLGRNDARLDLHRLGWSEVAVATAFVLLLIAAFRLTPLAG